MKIRSPWLIKAASFAGSWLVQGWIRSLRYEYQPLGPNLDPLKADPSQRYIYAVWHESLLLPALNFRGAKACLLISQHSDGEFIAHVARHLGFAVVRGSATRGGTEALRQLVQKGRQYHLAITPDGPRGPRRQVKPGLIYLAARVGLPIVAAGFGFQQAWRLNTWDRLVLPYPRTRAICVTSEPIVVPPTAARDGQEHYRKLVEETLNHLTDVAQSRADRAPALKLPQVSTEDMHRRRAG